MAKTGITIPNTEGTEVSNPMGKFLHGGGGLVGTATVNTFYPLNGGATGVTTINQWACAMPLAGLLSKLQFESVVPPGAGEMITCTIWKNGIATSLSVTISGNTDHFGVNNTDTVNYTSTDLIVVCITNSLMSAVTRTNWGLQNIIP